MSVNYVEKYEMIPVEKLGDLMSTEAETRTPSRGRPYNFYSMQRRNSDFGEYYFGQHDEILWFPSEHYSSHGRVC